MINYLIVDDEPQARKLLQAYLEEIPGMNLLKQCSSAMEAYQVLHTSKTDLIFLDIKMPLISGTDFLRSLKNPPLVIFTTAFNKYAMEGYELNVVDYLLKPIALPRLLTALDKVKERLHKDTIQETAKPVDYIFIKTGNKLLKINFDDIFLIEGLQNYVKIHLAGRVLIANNTMKAIEELLPPAQFLRTHRSYIVPKKLITAVNGNIIETTYRTVPVGVSYKTAVVNYVTGKGSGRY